MNKQLVIEIQGLMKNYGSLTAVDNLSLSVAPGEIFGFLGPNGAGKTTTVRILTTLTKPSAGRALVSGHDVVKEPVQAKRGMGVVPQHTNVDPDLTVAENLRFHGMLHKMPSSVLKARIDELLHFASLSKRRGELSKNLSGGLKRRLMIARAMLHQPKVLFLDEPTVGLDAHTRRRTWELIRHSHELGLTIFLTTHYIEEAEALCHRVGIIHEGSLIALDTPQNLKANTGKVVVESQAAGRTHFFNSREEAAAFVSNEQGELVIRDSNLEDVFIRLTGRRVSGESNAQTHGLQESKQNHNSGAH
ncbi:MAG: ABC transporter ATP-binding protein [Desulfarculaceae bacterium]|jgi:ABC-2 type transport system ATP-binding protein